MKKLVLSFAVILATTAGIYTFLPSTKVEEDVITANLELPKEGVKELEPHDQWLVIRSYPDGFDQVEFMERLHEIEAHKIAASDNRDVELSLDWQQEGPGNIGGRVDVLTISPTDQNIIYAGATNGGVFKTIDGGDNWTPIFDDQPYLAIGAITLDPENESIIYVGTGDRNFTGVSFIGNGVYKSTDAGATWNSIGLEETGAVTEIIIDPTNSDRIFASTLGNPHVKTFNRGIYRSDDAGETWTNKLIVTDSSGIVDLIMDPSNPNILYASGYNRMRNYYGSTIVGPQARIYKSINGGDSWVELGGGLPTGNECRIGLAISNEDPSTVFALYVDGSSIDVKDIYKSTNGGTTWSAMNVHDGPGGLPDVVMGNFGWYFGEVYLNPYNNDHLIIPGVDMYQSLDGGATWDLNVPEWWTYEVHADKHAIVFLDDNSYIIGTDGGIYRTDNNGATWTDIENLPITQLYHIDVHPHEDGLYGGGAQDNGSMSGNAASFNSWERLYGGDGFRVTFLDVDAGAAYYETQNGNLRYVPSGGGSTNVSPSTAGADRSNWDMPYYINEQTAELFCGTASIQLMEGAPFGSHEYISGDLTRVGLGGPYEGTANYHTITEIDQPLDDENLLYVGTSDGLLWRGERDGGSWDWINITGDLPNRYVTGVRCSPNNPGTVYVCFSGYKNDEDIAYLYKSDDFGDTWTSVSSDLPGITVNDVLIVPGYPEDEYLFAALDGGVYFSANNGGNWDYMGVGMPVLTVSELHLDAANEKLIAGTFSRSIWSYDVSWMEPIVVVVDDAGMEENPMMNKLTLYPNPVLDEVFFDRVEEDQMQLYSLDGKSVGIHQIIHLNGSSKVNLSHLKTGTYIYVIGNKSGILIKK